MATSVHLRRINQRRIVHSMLRCRSASRTQLAEMAQMSQATVGRIVDDLISQSVLAEIDNPIASASAQNGAPQLGRPSRPLELDRSRRRFLLVQLGVRQTRLAAVPVAIPSQEDWPVNFATPPSSAEWRDALRAGCLRLPLRDVEAVILSSPGVVDEPASKVLLSPNLRWEERTDFPAVMRSVIDVPLIIIQEIRALALGQLAAEPQLEDFLLVDFGEGVGAASMVMSRLQTGHIPLSGELGHTPVLNNDRVCGCGATGCVETLASRPGMIRSSIEHGGVATWSGLLAEIQSSGLSHWLKQTLDATAMTVAAALNVEGIASVLFTGSITELPAAATGYLFAQVQRGAMWGRLGAVNCKTAPRRRMAGMICTGIDRVLFASEA